MCVSGSTAERVCLAGDSAGGNLCITVSMKAISCGIRVPDGVMAAYPATLLTTDASPSRLLTLIDPLLPLGVLTKCLNAYAGMWVYASFNVSALPVTAGTQNRISKRFMYKLDGLGGKQDGNDRLPAISNTVNPSIAKYKVCINPQSDLDCFSNCGIT